MVDPHTGWVINAQEYLHSYKSEIILLQLRNKVIPLKLSKGNEISIPTDRIISQSVIELKHRWCVVGSSEAHKRNRIAQESNVQ